MKTRLLHPWIYFSFAVALSAIAFAADSSPAQSSAAQVKAEHPFLSPVFGDNMVLQRGKPNTFWGWTVPGESVRVRINERTSETKADGSGRWSAQIDPPEVGVPCVVQIDGGQHIELKNVVVGDVWLCGGQSNMQFGLAGSKDGAAEVAAADHPMIRLFVVKARSAYSPADLPKGGPWKICSPKTVTEDGGFSAVAYYFAQRVQAETGVPIGLIQDCLGGTPVECWMSPSAVAATKQFDTPMEEISRLQRSHAPEYGSYIMHWYDDYDLGLRGTHWETVELDDHDWKRVHIPGAFAELGLSDVPAVCWFRKEIVLPDPLPSGVATIKLGVVEKMETTYVNGHFVGASSWVENPRVYAIPAGVLHPGRNVIALRVFKLKSKTAFLSPAEQLQLVFADGPKIELAGEWKGAVSVDARPPHPLPLGFENYPIMPTVLYQGMIHPLVPLALKGALWYQGEANASRAHQYRTLLPAMINDWRRVFAQGDFPFLIAGLPAFQARKSSPGSDDWAELREAQAFTSATVANTDLAITIDTGDAANIHPKEKKPVGERLAAIALGKYYGKKAVYEGPTFDHADWGSAEVRIHFQNTDGGLTVHGEKLGEFSLAGSDRQWHWAAAKLDGDTVIVSSPEVPRPVAVRYAWQANPLATLFNGAGFPAAPFRSDDWPGVTDNAAPW